MKYTLRALLAVGLLIGFYVVCAAVLVLLGLAVYEIGAHGVNGVILGKFAIVVVLIGLAMARGLFGRRRNKQQDPGGLLVSEQEQPALWAEVRSLAAGASTRPPSEIRLVPEVNAAVSEDSRLLGLIPGTRRLFVGVPLLMGLSTQQFRSVLAHELGHYSGRHTALAGVSYRGKESIGRVLGELGPESFVGKFLGLYGRLFLVVSHSVNRRQELEADVLSAELVGPAIATSALQELPPLDAAWDHFLEQYVGLGDELRVRPADLFDGFRSFLADPVRQQQLAEIRSNPSEPARSVYDTHPSIAERVRAFAAMDRPDQPDTSGPALQLISFPEQALGRLQELLYAGSGLTPVPFERLVPEAAAAAAHRNATALFTEVREKGLGSPTLGGVLQLLESGQGHRLFGLVDGDEQQQRAVIADLLAQAVTDALVDSGHASCRLNWGGRWTLVDNEGVVIDPWSLVESALASSAGAAELARVLAEEGVPLSAQPVAAETGSSSVPASTEPTRALGAVAPVTGQKFRVLLTLDTGLLLRRPDGKDRWALAKGSVTFSGNGGVLVRSALKRPLTELVADPRSVYLPWSQVTRVEHEQKKLRRGRLVVTAADGRSWRLKVLAESETAGQPWDALAHFLGERYTRG